MKYSILSVMVLLLLAGCGKKITPEYQKEITDWQQNRIKNVPSENGWLTLCGLFWLKEGENKFGTDSSNAIVLPKGKALPAAGSIWLEHDSLRLVALPGSNVKIKDSLVTSYAPLVNDADTAGPTIINIGTVNFFVIKRADKLGIRVKDKENPNRLNFAGLDFFPIEPKWRIEAKFDKYFLPKVVPIATVINTVEQDTALGSIIFNFEGATYHLEALHESGTDDKLYIMFSDETSGKETYGAGRQLYTDLPDANNSVVIDFNEAYNWPCDYTEFATCPIPPPQNHLGVRVEAGEKKYPGSKH
ncbi:MAG: DUF1684 domain-containing protein [Bacteroidota bacterium]